MYLPNIKIFFLVIFIFLSIGCASKNVNRGAANIDNVRPKPEFIKTIEMQINRKEYSNRLIHAGNLNVARLVDIYSRETAGGYISEYRVFDIRKGSVLELLGLQNIDILVAANNYVVPNQEVFWQYLGLLQNERVASIEIRRNGQPLLFKYTFID